MKPLPFGIFCTLTFSDAGTRQSHPMPSPLKKTLGFKISTPLTDCCSIALPLYSTSADVRIIGYIHEVCKKRPGRIWAGMIYMQFRKLIKLQNIY